MNQIHEKYTIIDTLGESLMSSVYLALDENNDKVVIKALNIENQVDAEAILRFQKEASLIRALDHPFIIHIKSIERNDKDQYLIIMEYFNGKGLKHGISGLADSDMVDIIINIAEALDFIHANNIIHRDIKPDNILISSELDIRIIDFGLAYLKNEKINDKVLGSFNYISPEQTGLLRRPIDNRSDLYSLGAMMYELFIGRPPFVDEDIGKVIHMHLAKTPDSPSAYRDDIEPMLARIILKLLKKEPNERYQSAKGLIDDLLKLKKHPGEIFPLGGSDKSVKLHYHIKPIDRDKEILFFKETFEEVKKGKPEFIFIRGNSGIGKDKLANFFIEEIIDQHVFQCNYKCSIASSNVPLGPVSQLISDFFSSGLAAKYKQLIKNSNCNINTLKSVFPEFQAFADNEKKPEEVAARDIKKVLFESLLYLFEVIFNQDETVIFYINSYHSVDKDTEEFIDYISSYLSSAKLLFIATIGNEIFNQKYFENIRNKPSCHIIDLKPLSRNTIRLFVDKVLNEETDFKKIFYSKLYEISLGNPFNLIEMIKSLYKTNILYNEQYKWYVDYEKLKNFDFQKDLRDFVIEGLKKFSSQERKILELASIIGNEFDLNILGDIILDEFSFVLIIGAIDKAISEGIIEEKIKNDKVIYSFVHNKIKKVLSQEIGSDIEELHLRCARALEKKLDHADRDLYQIAYHYGKSSDIISYLNYCKLAYKKALSQYSLHLAVYYMSEIVGWKVQNDRDEFLINIIIEMVKYLQIAGEVEKTFDYIRTGLEICEQLSLDKQKIELYLLYGLSYHFVNDTEKAIFNYNKALDISHEIGKEIKVAYPYRIIGRTLVFSYKQKEAQKFLEKAILYADSNDINDLLQSHAIYMYTKFWWGDFDGAYNSYKVIEDNLSKVTDTLELCQLYHVMSVYLSYSGIDLKKALHYTLQAYEYAVNSENVFFQYSSLHSRMLAYFALGDYEKGLDTVDRMIEMSKENNIKIAIYINYAYQALFYLYKKEINRAKLVVSKYRDDSKEDDLARLLFYISEILIKYYMSDIEQVLALIDEGTELFNNTDMGVAGIFIITIKAKILKKYNMKEQAKSAHDEVNQLLNKKPKLSFLYERSLDLFSIIEEVLIQKVERENYIHNMNSESTHRLKEQIQLNNIIQYSQLVSSILDIDQLLEAVMDKTLEVTGAERGALLLFNSELDEFEYSVVYNNKDEDFKVPTNIIDQVKKYKKGVVITSISEFYDYSTTQSIISQNIRSIICSPLILKNKLIGLLYLDSKLLENLFTEEQLEVLEVFTTQAAIAFDNAKAYEELKNERKLLDDRVRERTEDLNKAKKFIENIIDNSPFAIQTINKNGVITLDNPAMRLILALNETNSIGINIFDIPAIKNTEFSKMYKNALDGIPFYADNIAYPAPQPGEELYLNLVLVPLFDQNSDEVEGVLTMFYDNTQKAIAERTIQEDLQIANNIQKNLLLQDFKQFEHANIALHFSPMMEVGGDLYDAYKINDYHYRFFIADATGHGIQAAMVTMLVKSEYDKMKKLEVPPNEVLKQLNNVFSKTYFNLNVYMTCFILDVNIFLQTISYASAGHPDQYFISSDGIKFLNAKGPLLGVFKDTNIDLGVEKFQIGDKVLLFTDGIFEESSKTKEIIGEERFLHDYVLVNKEKKIHDLLASIVIEVDKWRLGKEADDDVTLFGIEFNRQFKGDS